MNTPQISERMRNMWDVHAATYAERIGYDLSVEQLEAWRQAHADAAVVQRGSVLDVGTGPGFLALLFSGMGHRCIGVDSSEEMLKAALLQARGSGSQCSFMHADAAELPFVDESFDVVVNRHLLWTLPEPLAALREWVRVLRPGGRLIVIDGMWDMATSAAAHTGTSMGLSPQGVAATVAAREVYCHLPMRNASADMVMELMDQAGLRGVYSHDIERLMDADMRSRSPEKQQTYNRNRYMIVGEKR